MTDIPMSRSDAEKIHELLEGYALLLRSTLPDRLFELLNTLDQTGVYEPLRYGLPTGPVYVGEVAEEINRRLIFKLQDGGQ